MNLRDASTVSLHLILVMSGCNKPIGSLHVAHVDLPGMVQDFKASFFLAIKGGFFYCIGFSFAFLLSRIFFFKSSSYHPLF